jgi:uncharacterized protein
MFSSGDVVLVRWLNAGRVSRVKPTTVVEETDAHVSLFLAAGTPLRVRCALDGRPLDRAQPYAERFAQPWCLGEGTWRDSNVLMLTPFGAAHSFWAFWDESWAFHGWYVNLQEPLRPSRFGFDTEDAVLDVELAADLESWSWKDEDELEEAVAVGRFTRAEAAELYREGRRALETVAARRWPFDLDRRAWRPDPNWRVPALPDGCDVV